MPQEPAKRKEGEPVEQAPEHIPTVAKVCAYLLKTGRGPLCRLVPKIFENKELNPDYPWAVESVLVEDLVHELSKSENANSERVNDLRSLIYGASCLASEKAPTEEELLAAIPSLLTATPTLKDVITEKSFVQREEERYEKVDESDKRELDALESQIELIAKAIKERPCDGDAEPAVRAIETFTNSATEELSLLTRLQNKKASPVMEKRSAVLRERLNNWRPIRNYLYYFRAYKRWCEISHAS